MSMRATLIFFWVSVLLLVSTPPFLAQEKLSYTIGPEDVLEISVWQHPELDKVVTVRPDGKISFSLIGDVDTTGLTPAELDEVITRRLSEYVQNPEVTVVVSEIKSGQIIILGQVTTPGVYPMGQSITVLEAVAKAGSYTDRAALAKVTITRRSRGGHEVIKVDLEKVIVEGDRSKDIILEPDDVVFLPRKKTAWDIFDRYFIGGVLPVVGFIVMIDAISRY